MKWENEIKICENKTNRKCAQEGQYSHSNSSVSKQTGKQKNLKNGWLCLRQMINSVTSWREIVEQMKSERK